MTGIVNSLNSKKFAFILSAVLIVLSVIPIVIYYIVPGNNGSDAAIANNGIRLVKTLDLSDRPVGFGMSTHVTNIKVGEMFLGTNNNLHKVVQIRLAQDGSYFILHTTKKLSRYSNFREFVSDGFDNPKIENVITFVENKRKVEYAELQQMFDNLQLANSHMHINRENKVIVAAHNSAEIQHPPAIVAQPLSENGNIYIIDDVELATMIAQDSDTTTKLQPEEFESAQIVDYVEVH